MPMLVEEVVVMEEMVEATETMEATMVGGAVEEMEVSVMGKQMVPMLILKTIPNSTSVWVGRPSISVVLKVWFLTRAASAVIGHEFKVLAKFLPNVLLCFTLSNILQHFSYYMSTLINVCHTGRGTHYNSSLIKDLLYNKKTVLYNE